MANPRKSGKEPGFEEALARLESIVADLEGGDLPLEESLRLFEEGVGLTRLCAARLDQAQRRIEMLTRGEAGEPATVPFDPKAAAPEDTDGPA